MMTYALKHELDKQTTSSLFVSWKDTENISQNQDETENNTHLKT